MTQTVKKTKEEQVHSILFDMEPNIRSSEGLVKGAFLIADYGQLHALDEGQCAGIYEVIRSAIEALESVKAQWQEAVDVITDAKMPKPDLD
jgi:hypothetical protein